VPNWVYNTVKITGSESELAKFRKQASEPYESRHQRTKYNEHTKQWELVAGGEIVEGDLLFWNFIKPDNLDEYYEGSNWYDWNVDNWGTKWEAGSTEQYYGDGALMYQFETAWSPPEQVLTEIVRQYPGLTFDIKCVEEQGWGVEYSGIDGDLVTDREWDIPCTHAQRMELIGYCHCEEMGEDELDYMHEDCPMKKEMSNA